MCTCYPYLDLCNLTKNINACGPILFYITRHCGFPVSVHVNEEIFKDLYISQQIGVDYKYIIISKKKIEICSCKVSVQQKAIIFLKKRKHVALL